MSIDPIIAASLAPHLGLPPKPLQFPRPRPFADQIAALDRAHEAMLGHLEAGERHRAIDAILTNMVKLSSALESLGAFKPQIVMDCEWDHLLIRDHFAARRGWMLAAPRCIAIDITEILNVAPVRVEDSFSLDIADFDYVAELVDFRWIKSGQTPDGKAISRAVGIYEIEVLSG